MTDEFPGAVGDRTDDGAEEFEVERSGADHAKAAVGCDHAGLGDLAPKGAVVAAENFGFGVTSPEVRAAQQVRKGEWLRWDERIADGANVAGASRADDGGTDRRQHVDVLVGVDVGDRDTGILKLANLGGDFGFDFRDVDLLAERRFCDIAEAVENVRRR